MVMPALHPTDHRHWTARQVRELIAASPLAAPRYELVDGELLVTPSPHFLHQDALTRLTLKLSVYLEREPVGRVVQSPSDVELEPEFISQPDAFVVPMREVQRLRTGDMPIREVMLAIELLSPSSSRHDRVRKRPMYQRHVPQYWIVDLDARLVERWRPTDERPEVLTRALDWHPAGAVEPFALDLVSYFTAVFGER